MTREEVHQLLTEIGGAGEYVGLESDTAQKRSEEDVLVSIHDRYGGLLLEGDAIHQFYFDAIRGMLSRLSPIRPSEHSYLFFHWHVLSASRFAAAYDLFKRGYYFEAATLARTLWETALTMTAIHSRLVSVSEIFGGLDGTDAESRSSPAMITARMRRIDAQIAEKLIWKNPRLSAAGIHGVEVFLRLMHQSTHRSNLGLMLNMGLVEETRTLPIFPHFSVERTEAVGNLLFLATWCLLVTLRYMTDLFPSSSDIADRYSKLLLFFKEEMKHPPNPVVEGFRDVLEVVFLNDGTP